VLAKGYEAYHWAISRTRPEYLAPDPSDCSVAVHVLVREDPDEEEAEDKGDGKEDDDDDDEDDDDYSE
jgi:hypothetical protein